MALEIEPIQPGQAIDPKLVADLVSFLAIMEKAGYCQQGHVFSRLLGVFLEEVDVFLDDQLFREQDDLTEEVDELVEKNLSPEVQESLRRLRDRLGKK